MLQLQEAHQRGDILVLSTCSCTGYYENVSYDILVSLHIISSLSHCPLSLSAASLQSFDMLDVVMGKPG